MSGWKARPCSDILFSPTAHATPGNKATAPRSLSGGSVRLLNVVQTAPSHTATRALEWGGVGTVAPTATALLDDRAATASKPPGTGGMSSGEGWPVGPAAGAVAMRRAVQARS